MTRACSALIEVCVQTVGGLMFCALNTAFGMLVVLVTSPLVLLLVVPLAWFYSRVQGLFIKTTRCAFHHPPRVSHSLQCTVGGARGLTALLHAWPQGSLHADQQQSVLPGEAFWKPCACRELKRIDSLAMSPIFGHFGETLHGLLTLRAFRRQDMFTQRNHHLLDSSNRAYWGIQEVCSMLHRSDWPE